MRAKRSCRAGYYSFTPGLRTSLLNKATAPQNGAHHTAAVTKRQRRITRTRELGAGSGREPGTAISPRRHVQSTHVWGLPIALLSKRCHAQRGSHPVGLFHLERAGGRVGEVWARSRRLGRHVSREGAGEHRRHAPRRPPPPASCARCPRLLLARPPRPPLGPAWSSSSCLPRSSGGPTWTRRRRR